MKDSLTILFGIFVLLSVSKAAESGTDSPKKENFMETIRCQDKELPFTITAALNDSIKICLKKVFGSEFDQKKMSDKVKDLKKISCLAVCQAQELNLTDESLQFQKEKIYNTLSDFFPEDVVTKMKPKVESCIKEFGSDLKVTENDCSSVGDLFKCFKGVYFDICLPEFAEMLKKKNQNS